MNICNKLDKINEPEIKPYIDGYDNTIEEFFNNFVKPRLPKEDTIKNWHKLLMEYTKDENFDKISCCVRFGNNGSTKVSKQGESGYYKLRRGWLTRNTDDCFEYFFADNFFSSFIYKMSLDGFCPGINEFTKAFTNHEFPYGFGFKVDKKINEYKGVVIPTAKEPGFLGKYKLSHVFDSGENFLINGKTYSGKCDTKLSELYYDIGHSDDYLNKPDQVRVTKIDFLSKKVIVAKFLRLAHPFNYFLTPPKNKHYCEVKVDYNDIGEDRRMIAYMKNYLEKTYPKEYKEFIDKILWYDGPNGVKEDGTTKIKIHYFNKPCTPTTTSCKKKVSKRNSLREKVFKLIKVHISKNKISSLNELNLQFPRIASLVDDVKDPKRYINEIITLPNGDEIKITNQIGNKPGFPSNRNFSNIVEKMAEYGITLNDISASNTD